MKKDTRDVIAQTFIDALSQGIVPWRKPWRGGNMTPRNPVTGTIYKGGNALYLGLVQSIRGFATGEWFTYNNAKASGGHVIAGEHGYNIFFVQWMKKENKVTGKDSVFPMTKVFTVFNRQQCEGLPEREPTDSAIVEPIASAEAIVKGFTGPQVVHGGDRACYVPLQDRIEMPPMGSFINGESYYHTLFHELAHSTGHDSRLKRPLSQMVEAYSREELIAEITASFLSAEAGTLAAVQENSLAYVQGWAKRLGSEPRLIIEAANAAQKAADCILGVSAAPEGKGGDE
jgi:antirestriction protein ArdC